MLGTAGFLAVARHHGTEVAGTAADMASIGERQVRSERVGKYLLHHTIGKGTFGKCVTLRRWLEFLAEA